jgi:hypothetical protein
MHELLIVHIGSSSFPAGSSRVPEAKITSICHSCQNKLTLLEIDRLNKELQDVNPHEMARQPLAPGNASAEAEHMTPYHTPLNNSAQLENNLLSLAINIKPFFAIASVHICSEERWHPKSQPSLRPSNPSR